jgi:hypothetical protein
MAIAIAATRTALAATYAAQGTYFGLATASPGTSATPANEASGSGYARVATTWSAGTAGVQNGTAVTITAGAATYTYCLLASSATTGAANMVDNAAITSTVLSATGQIVLTPTFTQS